MKSSEQWSFPLGIMKGLEGKTMLSQDFPSDIIIYFLTWWGWGAGWTNWLYEYVSLWLSEGNGLIGHSIQYINFREESCGPLNRDFPRTKSQCLARGNSIVNTSISIQQCVHFEEVLGPLDTEEQKHGGAVRVNSRPSLVRDYFY